MSNADEVDLVGKELIQL